MATSNDTVTRIFGGSPLAVLGRLILVSILVGVILSALGAVGGAFVAGPLATGTPNFPTPLNPIGAL